MSQHLECRLKPQVLNRLVLGKLRRFVMKHVLLRQYKDLQPAQQALRQPQAPHTRGFLLGVPDQVPPQCPGVNSAHGWREIPVHPV